MRPNKAQKHHCDVCGKMGDVKVCLKKGHMAHCQKHPDALHSAYQQCVKCTAERKRAEREEREASLAARNSAESEADNPRKGGRKKENKPFGEHAACAKAKKDKASNDRFRRRSA